MLRVNDLLLQGVGEILMKGGSSVVEAVDEEQTGIVHCVFRGEDWVGDEVVLDPGYGLGEEVGARAQEIEEGEEGQYLAPQEAGEDGQPRQDHEIDQTIEPPAVHVAQDTHLLILWEDHDVNPFQGAGTAVRKVHGVNVEG